MTDLITAGDVADLRAMADEVLDDTTCRITDPATEVKTFNDDTGQYDITTPATVVYEGGCRIRTPAQSESSGSESESGEREWTYQNSVLQLPVATSGSVRVGQELVVLTNAHDADLVDRVFRIGSVQHGTHQVVRRCKLEEVTG